MSATTATKIAVRAIMEDEDREWSIQWLGMLRTYLPDNSRLHIWDPDAKREGASELHTHPWDMQSFVVNGEVRNHRFVEFDPVNPHVREHHLYMKRRIRCGEGGGFVEGDEPELVGLRAEPIECVRWGETYSQAFDVIHLSEPMPGTVTLVQRSVPEGGHPDYAYVYWPKGCDWGTAEPRTATREEVEHAVALALESW